MDYSKVVDALGKGCVAIVFEPDGSSRVLIPYESMPATPEDVKDPLLNALRCRELLSSTELMDRVDEIMSEKFMNGFDFGGKLN